MKKIIISLVATTGLFAFDAEVKKGSVDLLINDQNKMYKLGEKFVLNAGDIVCFVDGEGRVIIKGESYKKQLSKRSKSCKHLPGEDGKPTVYAQAIKNSIVSIFEKSNEKSVDGVSRKSVDSNTLTAPIFLGKNAKYLVLENSTWGPLPITLELLNHKSEVIETMVNEEDISTSFILPKRMLDDGYIIKVSNAFDELLVNTTIHF